MVSPDGDLLGSAPASPSSSPSLSVTAPDGTFYEIRIDGNLYAVDTDTGTEKWIFEPDSGSPLVSTPLIGPDGSVYVGGDDGRLYVLNPDDGSLEWALATAAPISAPPLIYDGVIYISSEDGKLYSMPSDSAKTFTGISVKPKNKWVALSWDGVAGATEYRIYYQETAGVLLENSTQKIIADTATSTNITTGLINNTTYYFLIEARNAEGGFLMSSEYSMTPVAPDIDTEQIYAGEVYRIAEATTLSIPHHYKVGRYEVTQGLWEHVMGPENWPGTAPSDTYGLGDDYPMYNVSWNDIVLENGFLDKLNEAIGCTAVTTITAGADRYNPDGFPAGCYRLPSADEAEYAHRASTKTMYYWGDEEDETTIKQYAWYRNNALSSYWTEPHADNEYTQPIGLKLPNSWDLYDMSGNVWELTYTISGSERINRGGSWNSGADRLRPSYRGGNEPTTQHSSIGFRLTLSVAGQPPTSPTDPSAISTYNEVTLSWTESAGASSYRIYYSETTGVTNVDDYVEISAPAYSGTVSSLESGITYYFRISALNEHGESLLSQEIDSWTILEAPYIYLPSGGSNKLSLFWMQPRNAKGYRVYYKTSSGVTTADPYVTFSQTSSGSVTGLEDATRYYLRIEAFNDDGVSPLSDEVSGTTAPGIPTEVSATGGINEIIVNWAASIGATYYDVYYKTEPGVTTSDSVWAYISTTSATINKLQPGIRYYFRVLAKDSIIKSDLSSEANALTCPDKPAGVKAGGGINQIAVQWDTVTGADSFRIYYKDSVDVTTSDLYVAVAGSSATSGIITGLDSGIRYYFRVEAINESGSGPLSSEVNAWTDSGIIPPAPTLNIFAGYKHYLLDYSAAGATEYQLATQYYSEETWSEWTENLWSSDNPFKQNTTVDRYKFKVRARNSAGTGPYSIEAEEICTTDISVQLIPAGTTAGITISESFHMGTYLVTQKLWQLVMGPENWPGTAPSSTYGVGDDYPMYNVSWEDINKKGGFLDTLNELDGNDLSGLDEDMFNRYKAQTLPSGYWRLPSKNEFIYAIRAGTESTYYWGESEELEDIDQYAWYYYNRTTSNYPESYPDGTKPVGLKKPNAWGLYDMSGNLRKWTNTRLASEYYYYICNGYYRDTSYNLKSSYSTSIYLYTRSQYYGFRLMKQP